MAEYSPQDRPECHVLNFFHDKDNTCALIVLCNNVRFHIIADPARISDGSQAGKDNIRKYQQLTRRLKQAQGAIDNDSDAESDDYKAQDDSTINEESSKVEGDSDSGVDMQPPPYPDVATAESCQKVEDTESALQNWMIAPFGTVFAQKAPRSKARKHRSLQDWYGCTTYHFTLDTVDDKLHATAAEESKSIRGRIGNMTPCMTVPKYILKHNIPWIAARDITVLEESDSPPPYHPTRVRVDGNTFFLKVVDMSQPGPTKREIELMKRIEKLGLHQKMNVPLLKGLAGFEDSHNKIMGFLMTEISGATPLTKMLDEDVPQEKRDKWAAEAGRIKDLLHENDIIWGDAKADNFMVDRNEKLWIIDFGGSYTEGWIDPELNETEEGDDMGVVRITNALHDPVANTWDPEEGDEQEAALDNSDPSSRRRKRKASVDDECSHKQRKAQKALNTESSVTGTDDQEDARSADHTTYCCCNEPESGKMIACDNRQCEKKWFHFDCANIEDAPKGQKWFCKDCKQG